ncbi:DUF922 domain-containing protein [Rubrivirga sp. S365]|uniref:DUF922 domain-containing protein n=1 Tax=Rubrivirga litoralis TaxID=3075598 RepID=A0ABU3BS93_9BACT|nr:MULTISPECIES: DUF922 domain-containing protein [unclassified Rubrivirga]MDT0632147.1 DUF922 domain-containing protein [Rubrivirga sp. F394]MDT7857039.1 DUF922 domain-containing protein [Rubrivirga sp. S365]
MSRAGGPRGRGGSGRHRPGPPRPVRRQRAGWEPGRSAPARSTRRGASGRYLRERAAPPLRPLALVAALALVAYAGRPAPPAAGSGGAETPREPPAPPTLRTRLDVRPYAVRGRSVAEVHRSMRAGGPTDHGTTYFGMTASDVVVRFRAVAGGAGCRLEAVEVDLDLTMTLPDWDPGGPVDYALRRDWARFTAALRRHEDGHRDRAVAGAEALADAFASVHAPTCPEADAEGRRRVREAYDRTAAEQERYDRETDHGRTEGAAWPLDQ